MRTITAICLAFLFRYSDSNIPFIQHQAAKTIVPVGIFLGRIEEGARIFTPIRLLPFDHPESEGHQFPNALQLYATEYDVLVWLGRLSGYALPATLLRYPKAPSADWPYKQFSAPPDTAELRSMVCIRRPLADTPLKGLRALLIVDLKPIGFIVDTRNLTLEERGMSRASTIGLDINRADFVSALEKGSAFLNGRRTGIVIFEP